MTLIYKICDAALWRDAERVGYFAGTGIDLKDGYIHFSARDQVAETASKHFAGRRNLLLIAVDADALGAALKWEVSRGGARFPHLYGTLPTSAVRFIKPMALDDIGQPVLPDLAD